MTRKEFEEFWSSNYPDADPIPFTLRHTFPDRWFRIHSLPESKRYADSDSEWEILLQRQNSLITDLLGEGSKFLLIVVDYYFEERKKINSSNIPLPEYDYIGSIPTYDYTELKQIDLSLINDAFIEGALCQPKLCEQAWHTDKFNNILTDIANESLEALFISKHNNCIIAPYDGGIDIVVEDELTRNEYKEKYAAWLSARPDGL